MRKILVFALILVFAIPQVLFAAQADPEQEPEPTPIIEAPPAPPLAISPLTEDVEEVDGEGRPLLLIVLIIVVSSATALAVGFYAFRKIRQFLAKRKKKKEEKKDI